MINKKLAKIKSIVIGLLICSKNLICQEDISIGVKNVNSEYKQSLRHLIMVKCDANTESNGINFKKVNDYRDFKIKPNDAINFRLSVIYKFIGLSYSFSPLINYEAVKGKTKYRVLTLEAILGKNLNLSYSLTNIKGYYLQNSKEYKLEFINQNKQYAVFENVNTTLFKAENYYYFNGNKFSIKFPINQYEIQRKSAGSVLLPLNYYYSKIDLKNETFADFKQINTNKYPVLLTDHYIISGLGYAYNWVITSKWILNINLTPIIGYDMNQTSFTENTTIKKNQATYGYQSSMVFGYFTQNLMLGIAADAAEWKSLTKSNNFTGQQSHLKFFIAKCFSPPKKRNENTL